MMGSFLLNSVFLASISAALIIWSSLPSSAAQCRNETRELQVAPKISARLRELSCRLDADPAATYRVQFQRLHESAAGVLLNNGKAPWTARLYGKPRVLENDVLRQYRELVGKFATAVRYKDPSGEGTGVGFGVKGANQPVTREPDSKVRPGVVETFELRMNLEGPLVDEIRHIIEQRTWPSTLRLSYAGHDIEPRQDSLFDQLGAWRYLTNADLDGMEANLKRYNALVARKDRQYVPARSRHTAKALQLMRYLTADGLPDRFGHYISSVSGDDGCMTINFSLEGSTEFEVDIAVVYNTSRKPLEVGRLTGSEDQRRGLRLLERDDVVAVNGSAFAVNSHVLQPDESLLIPLRIVFGQQDRSHLTAEGRRNSEERYRRIQAARPATEFKLTIGSELELKQKRGKEPNTYVVVKTRESFTPHSEPEARTFSFGPQWALAGATIGGEEVRFANPNRDTIHFTVAGGAGSCPILYAWSESDSRWVKHGKVLHKAQGKAKQQTEIVRFEGFVPKFVLSEEELEVARIRDVRVSIELDDGTVHWPELTVAGREDRSAIGPFELYADEEIELALALPSGVAPARVRETRFAVTGYYDRYSALLVAAARGATAD